MASIYEYYKELCKCPGISMPGAGDNEAHFDYYRRYCVCDGTRVSLGMRDLDDQVVSNYPVTVYNVNEVEIGEAANQAEYIAVWNSDPDNQDIGVLFPGAGPFNFILVLNPGKISPPWVLGVPEELYFRIHEKQYEDQYE